MDAAFLAVVAVSLLLISAMIVMRMSAAGMPGRKIALPVAELWLALAVWVAVLRAIAGATGSAVGADATAEIGDLAARAASIQGAGRLWAVAGLTLAVGLAAHLIWFLRRSMSGNVRS